MVWLDQFRSQHGEDSWLCNHWAELRLPEYGFFVEFGAGDGELLSNTYWLEHSRGWHGLLCEPDPRNQILNRPASIIERVAIGRQGTMLLGQTSDPYLTGELRTAGAELKAVRAEAFVEVPSMPLSELLLTHGIDGVNLISIDTEGTELEAWRTLELSHWRPQVAIIELLTWGLADRAGEIIAAMKADGYELAERTYHNGIFRDAR
jgi:FkbM family methyltransferase